MQQRVRPLNIKYGIHLEHCTPRSNSKRCRRRAYRLLEGAFRRFSANSATHAAPSRTIFAVCPKAARKLRTTRIFVSLSSAIRMLQSSPSEIHCNGDSDRRTFGEYAGDLGNCGPGESALVLGCAGFCCLGLVTAFQRACLCIGFVTTT